MSILNTETFSTPSLGSTACAGMAGALLGGTLSAAKHAAQVNSGQSTKQEAAMAVGKEALGAGLAVAAGAAVAKMLFRSNPVGLAAMLVVTAGAKYAYDKYADTVLDEVRKTPDYADDLLQEAKKVPSRISGLMTPNRTTAQKNAKKTAKKPTRKAAPKKPAASAASTTQA